jgi:hypothetical protein
MPPIDVPVIPSSALDSVKAGVKTAIVAFLGQGFLAVTGLINEVQEYAQKGDPIDMSVAKAVMIAAVSSLVLGLLNTTLRFLQAIKAPIIAWVVTKLLGAVPAYPEAGVTKVLVDPNVVDVANPAAPIVAPATPVGEVGPDAVPMLADNLEDLVGTFGYAEVAAAFAATAPAAH